MPRIPTWREVADFCRRNGYEKIEDVPTQGNFTDGAWIQEAINAIELSFHSPFSKRSSRLFTFSLAGKRFRLVREDRQCSA